MNTRLFSKGFFSKEKKTLLPQYTRNYGTLKESKPFLLEELRACIVLLEDAKKKAPYKQPQLQRDYRRYAVLFMSLALLGVSSTGGALTVMLIMMRIAHDNILPELLKELQPLRDRLSNIVAQIEAGNDFLNKFEDYDSDLHDKMAELDGDIEISYRKWWDELEIRDHSHQYYDDKINIPESINNCVEWNDMTGRQKLITIFPNINTSTDPCWFSSTNNTHPLQSCSEIANTICNNTNQSQKLYDEHNDAFYKKFSLTDEIKKLSIQKDDLSNTITSIESRIANPYSEPEPITNTVFSVVALLSIIGIAYFAYRLYHSREAHHTDLESHGNSIQRYLSSIEPIQHSRVAKLALRLGSPIQEDTTIDFVLVLFKQKAQELELQRKKRMSFFAGVKIENFEAGNHPFLTNQASRNITNTIFEYAGLKAKR